MLVGILVAYLKVLSPKKKEVKWTCHRCKVEVYTSGPMPEGWLPLDSRPQPCLCGNCGNWARGVLAARAA